MLNDQIVPGLSSGTIAGIAQRRGFTLSKDAVKLITVSVEYRLRQVIQEAITFLKHSSTRSQPDSLAVADVRNALKSLRLQATSGYSRASNFQFLSASNSSGKETVPSVDGRPHIVDTFTLYRSKLLPTPAEPSLSLHWLAVEGTVPSVQENLPSSDTDSSGDDDTYKPVKLVKNEPFSRPRRAREDPAFEGLEVGTYTKPLKLALTREHQLYLDQIRKTIRATIISPANDGVTTRNRNRLFKVLISVGVSPGLGQLVPYLTKFISSEISRRITTGPLIGLSAMVQLSSSLLRNPNISLQYYLHQILQPLQSIVLYPFLASVPPTDSLALRREAAQAVAAAVLRFSSNMDGPGYLSCRVLWVYLEQVQNLQNAITSIIGAVMGIRAFGGAAVYYSLLPLIPSLVVGIQETDNWPDMKDGCVRSCLKMALLTELLSAISDSMTLDRLGPTPHGTDYFREFLPQLWDLLGDEVLPWVTAGLKRLRRPNDSVTQFICDVDGSDDESQPTYEDSVCSLSSEHGFASCVSHPEAFYEGIDMFDWFNTII